MTDLPAELEGEKRGRESRRVLQVGAPPPLLFLLSEWTSDALMKSQHFSFLHCSNISTADFRLSRRKWKTSWKEVELDWKIENSS